MRNFGWLAASLALTAFCTPSDPTAAPDNGGADRAEGDVSDGGSEGALDSPADDVAWAETEAAEMCEGVPVRCGRLCCTMDYMMWYYDNEAAEGRCDPTWWACRTKLTAWVFLRVDSAVVPDLPTLPGWTYRGDGSEVFLLARWDSPRWRLECANWCWDNGSVVYLLDASTEELVHAERIPVDVYLATTERLADYPFVRDCPAGPEASVSCTAVELGESGVSFVFYDPYIVDTDPVSVWRERLARMPTLECAVAVTDLERRETLRCIDLYVPE